MDFVQDGGCRASVDSLLNVEDFGPSLRSRGVLLQLVAAAQSTMDYSTMAVDEGVVDKLVARTSIRKGVISHRLFGLVLFQNVLVLTSMSVLLPSTLL